ncbi:MAG: 50S ribosomal protein L25 [Planctomycetota bacterium]|nr:50S ribosomal protein L25 [Planctomycetota bacterium]
MRYKKMVASVREERGTRACRTLRHAGQLPAVLYGGHNGAERNREVQSLLVNRKELEALIHDGIKFVDVEVNGQETNTVVKALQWDSFDDHILHVDFERIDLNKNVVVNVPVNFKGVAKGQKLGGRLNKFVQDVAVRGLPRSLPESLDVRIDDVGPNENLKVSDIVVGEGLEIVTPHDRMIMEVKVKRVNTKTAEEDEAAAEEK